MTGLDYLRLIGAPLALAGMLAVALALLYFAPVLGVLSLLILAPLGEALVSSVYPKKPANGDRVKPAE